MRANGLFRAALLLVAGGWACGPAPDRERGALPGNPPSGAPTTIAFDAGRRRLLKAYPHALYQSRDAGWSWEAIPLPPSASAGTIVAVVAPPKVPGTLFLGIRGAGVLRTDDDGATWRRLGHGLPSAGIEALAAHSTLDSTLYVFLAGDGVYQTEDGGVSWARMDGGPGKAVGQLLHSSLEGSMKSGWVYAGTPQGVQRTMDCFCGWRSAGQLPAQVTSYSVVVDPTQPAHLFAAGAAGVFRSVDGGESWELACGDAPEKISLAYDPAKSVLYAATREGAILVSRDGGAQWESAGG